MSRLTFYGGVGEIGGNKILLSDRDKKVFLDFGLSFEKERRYYEPPYLQPRNESHLLGLKMLPPVQGLYKNDERACSIDAIVLSHPHLDHYDYVRYVKDDIPLICGECTRNIIIAKELAGHSPSGYCIAKVNKTFGEDVSKDFRTFRTNNPPSDIPELSPIHVDHSVPGSYGFVIETSEGNIVYTGDFRLHGIRRDMSEEFIAKARDSEPSALIIEGTNLIGARLSCEEEVKSKVTEVIKNTTGLSMAGFSLNDVDRLRTFYEAAKAADRFLAISMKQAFLLHHLAHDPGMSIFKPDDPHVLIFTREKKFTYAWEDEIFCNYENIIAAQEAQEIQDKLVLTATLFDMNELIAIQPRPGSTYIMSQSEPYNEEMEINYEKLLCWLECFGVPHYQIHVSGHALPHQLKWAIKEIHPEKAFLVHTEKPDLYKQYLGDLEREEQIQVITPEEGVEYEV